MYDSTHISGKKAVKLVAKGALLFDTRSPVQFRDGTLAGAANISPRSVSALMKHPKNTKLVFFGDSSETTTIINYATQMGFTDVYTFGGVEDWDK
jgi:rhodanese-related sulfurtransferase